MPSGFPGWTQPSQCPRPMSVAVRFTDYLARENDRLEAFIRRATSTGSLNGDEMHIMSRLYRLNIRNRAGWEGDLQCAAALWPSSSFLLRQG